MYFFIGLTVFGVFGSFTYYLPELFPTRLRGTGAGFCYNVGRVVAAAGPFLVGTIASRGTDALASAMQLLFFVGVVPLRRRPAAALRRRDQGPPAGLTAGRSRLAAVHSPGKPIRVDDPAPRRRSQLHRRDGAVGNCRGQAGDPAAGRS
jgi:hypothetical protein